MQEIKDWTVNNNLDVDWINENTFKLNEKVFVCISPKEGKIFDQDFNLIIDPDELQSDQIDNLCFSFGGKVFYSPADSDKVKLDLLKYIGKAKELSGFPFLGIHGGYELCSGSRKYEDWCKKAAFLGIQTLGITERHTLAGILKFQSACLKSKIKPILGETVTIRYKQEDYKVKIYVINDAGWSNLLRIHKRLNIDNQEAFVEQEFLYECAAGLIQVIQNDTDLDKIDLKFGIFEQEYFQFDPVEYKSPNRDVHCLNCLRTYLHKYKDKLSLALITDAFYLDKEEAQVRKILSFIGKGNFYYQSDDQYFKSLEEVAIQSLELFETKGEEFGYNIFEEALAGVKLISETCNFKVKTGEIHLPKYKMTDDEASQFDNNEDLFWNIVEQGLKHKVHNKNIEVYLSRIESEYEVINKGGFQDYFLILRDIINWCEANDILVGTARGSAAGSLIAYLMNVVRVDPMEYDLIFERFLNSSRVGKGLPDIDSDFASQRREDVKRYMEQRFGVHNVCSIGTYSTLQTKAAFRDLLRYHGEEPKTINYYARMLDESSEDYVSIFSSAIQNIKLKEFINTHIESVQDVPIILGQPKSSSVHAAGVICAPTEYNGRDMQIYDWFPCKIIKGILVSEWEGTQLDDSGFLKADILGLTQLDKLHDMIAMIKKNHKHEINLNEIDTKDQNVFDNLFKKGLTQDVFQFTTDGLSAYCREVKPESIEELAAMNALYRPGPRGSGAHNDYVKIKFGKKKPEYDWGTEEILKSTYGLYVFQEQIIKMVQALAGFTLTDGDGVRKATGKKDLVKMQSYKEQFVTGCVKNGCTSVEANKIWNKIEIFAEYSFNLSHAISYSLIGYQTAWIKYHYPLEFWTISLQHADDDEIPKRISEMRKFEGLNVFQPDINKSRETFYTDFATNSIYWSLSRIKQGADVSLNAIIKEREESGVFFSLEEFCKRVKGKGVNSRVIKHLIITGCFDELHRINNPLERRKLIEEFFKIQKEELPDIYKTSYSEFFWYKQQRELSGFGYFDYSAEVDNKGFDHRSYVTPDRIQLSANVDCDVVVAGILVECIKRKTKKGEMGKLTIDHNNDLIDFVLWNEQWNIFKDKIEDAVGNGIILNGRIQYDNYNKKNTVYGNDKTVVEII